MISFIKVIRIGFGLIGSMIELGIELDIGSN